MVAHSAGSPFWWADWNPATHSLPGSGSINPPVQWDDQLVGGDVIRQPWEVLGPVSAVELGVESRPDCTDVWRTIVPGTKESANYAPGLETKFPAKELIELAHRGDSLVRNDGGLYPAIASVQELELRGMHSQLDFVQQHKDLCPVQYPALMRIPQQGVQAHYAKGRIPFHVFAAYPTIPIRRRIRS